MSEYVPPPGDTSAHVAAAASHKRPASPAVLVSGAISEKKQMDLEAAMEDFSKTKQDQRASPKNGMAEAIERGGIFGWGSYLTFAWAGPFLKLGSTVTLKEEHLEGIYEHHMSRNLYNRLRLNWEREKAKIGEARHQNRGRRKGTTLLRALVATFKWRLVLTGVLMIGNSTAHITQALALGWLIGYFDDENAASWEGWTYASCVVLCAIFFSLVHHHFFFVGWTFGMQLKVSASTILYDKILRLRVSSLGQISAGHLLNLMTSDVEKFQYSGPLANYLWGAPLETLVILYFGLRLVGVSFLAGFAALALMIPIQALFATKLSHVQECVTELTDERVKLTNQAVTGARLMKINAWEPALESEIRRVRAQEVRALLKATMLRAANEAMFFAQPAVVSCLVFGTYHLLGNVLSPQQVFTTLALLNITQLTMGKFFGMAVFCTSMSWVSIKRMEELLLFEENDALTAPLRELDTAVKPQKEEPTTEDAATATICARTTSLSTSPPPRSRDLVTRLATKAPRLSHASAAPASASTTQMPAGKAMGTCGAAGLGPGRNLAEVDGTAKAGGSSAGDALPGLVVMNGMSFRWASGGEEDEHAKILRRLVEARGKKKTKKSNVGGETPDDSQTEGGGTKAEATAEGRLTLDAIDLSIQPGQLVGVIGPVASSKSSLLMAVLKEIAPESACAQGAGVGAPACVAKEEGGVDMVVTGTLAYASQEPWIQSGTLKENILFGRRMDQERYDAVIRDCALERDLSLLPSGDETGIGDKGVNLSGGQKARVGLARMAYQHADIYLMDDPLSAVDPAVGRELFSNVVCGRLQGSTRILVTHQVHYLNNPAVDQIIMMDHGRIIAKGSYKELETSGRLARLGRPASTVKAVIARETDEDSKDDSRFSGKGTGTSAPSFVPALGPSSEAAVASCTSTNTEKAAGTSLLPTLEEERASRENTDALAEVHRGEEHKSGEKDDRKPGDGRGGRAAGNLSRASIRDMPSFGPERRIDGVTTGVARGASFSVRSQPRPAYPLMRRRSVGSITVAAPMEDSNGGDANSFKRDDFFTLRQEISIDRVAFDFTRSTSFSLRPRQPSRRALMRQNSKVSTAAASAEAGGGKGCSNSSEEARVTEVPPELVAPEDQESGVVKRGTYWEYAKEAASVWQMLLIFVFMAGGQVLVMGVTVWLARWSRQTEEEQSERQYVVVLGLLALATVVVSLLRAVLTYSSLIKASHRLHDRMLKRVLRAPVLFFDSNPVGRILNRFTKDVHLMDELLPVTMYDVIVCSFTVTGGTVIIFFVNPWVILSMIPAVWYFVHLMGYYVKSSRETKRLEAATRSPVYSQISETLDGLVTIRAFSSQYRFLVQFTERVDTNTRAYFAWVFTGRWLGFRMNAVVIVVLAASCFFSVAVNEYSDAIDLFFVARLLVVMFDFPSGAYDRRLSKLFRFSFALANKRCPVMGLIFSQDAGLLGAALLYVLQLGGLFQWAVMQCAEVQNQMVSAERVLSYCRVPQEAGLESEPDCKPGDDWPADGGVEIRDITMRYREDLPPVFKDLSLSIKGGSRVGVVGRTGAGKSSIISALFRLVEYDRDRGSIKVDGVDISKVGLHDLRPRMSVVPQTPFLFSGSVRLNLDPSTEHSDVEVWGALEAVQMKEYVQELSGGLDAPVAEGGGNLSVGQRQLMCLARAVLQRSQILILDEATANIDNDTDSLVQDVVRTSFKGKTVIMVAHRLHTIIDCDQVVVLSEGSVVEAGHPHLLLQGIPSTSGSMATPTSRGNVSAATSASLSSMVAETGHANAQHLRRSAREAWKLSRETESA